MRGAVIFDLDGTLVRTERLKAISYGRAAAELRPGRVSTEEVVRAFRDVVGGSRREVAGVLLRRFGLEEAARDRMAELGVTSPWQAYVQIRLRHYRAMTEDPATLRESRWPRAVALLEEVREAGVPRGLATMSHCPSARHVLRVLGLEDRFDFVATRDDVDNPKPDPEIYALVADALGVPRGDCVAVEDSPSGVRAARAAGLRVVVATTEFTREKFRQDPVVEPGWVVDDPVHLSATVWKRLRAHS